MVRLLIPLVAIILIWLLFFSPFSKRVRIIDSVILVALTVFGLWLDTNGRGVSDSRMLPEAVVSCGVNGSFSYRTNYNLELCLQNTSEQHTVRRLLLQIDALACADGECEVQDSVEETANITIESGAKIEHSENIAFPNLPEVVEEPMFTVQILKVWASK